MAFTRERLITGLAAIAGAAALERAGVLGKQRLTVPEKVLAAIPGVEKPLYGTSSDEIGRFYTQAGDQIEAGFTVLNDLTNRQNRFWDSFKRLGGVDVLGYPISYPFEKDGFTYQLFQGGALQVNPQEGSPDGIVLANSFDTLSALENKNKNLAELFRSRGIPAHKEGGFSPAERLVWLDLGHYSDPNKRDAAAALSKRFLTIGSRQVSPNEAAGVFGYPTSEIEDFGLYSCIRCQRIGFQYWQEELPNHPELPRRGSITSFLAGDLLKEAGWIPTGDYLEATRLAAGGGVRDVLPTPSLREQLVVSSQVTETVVREIEGTTYTLESRSANSARYKISFNSQVLDLFTSWMAPIAKVGKFDQLQLIAVVPGFISSQSDLSFKGGTTYKGRISGSYGSELIGSRLVVYYETTPDLPVNDTDLMLNGASGILAGGLEIAIVTASGSVPYGERQKAELVRLEDMLGRDVEVIVSKK